jgi:hypothetical protein
VPGSAVPLEPKEVNWQPRLAEAPKELWQRKAGEFVAWAHQQLLKHPEQLNYLACRGLPLEAVIRYRLGWNPGQECRGKAGPLFKQRSAWGLEDKRDDKSGKTIKVFPIQRGIVIPSFAGDEVYRIRIRRPDEAFAAPHDNLNPARYLFLEGSGKGLVIRNPEARAFVVVESDLDDLLIDYSAGDLVCSVALTSCSIRPDSDSAQVLLRAICTLNALDYDPRINAVTGKYECPGGQNARWWQKHFPNSERWPPPVGKDPGEAWQTGVDLREWIIAGLPISLQPCQLGPNNKPYPRTAAFDESRLAQFVGDTFSRVRSAHPIRDMKWLEETRPDMMQRLVEACTYIDVAFTTRDEGALLLRLKEWEDIYREAWALSRGDELPLRLE